MTESEREFYSLALLIAGGLIERYKDYSTKSARLHYDRKFRVMLLAYWSKRSQRQIAKDLYISFQAVDQIHRRSITLMRRSKLIKNLKEVSL
jgi:hypothetical protein